MPIGRIHVFIGGLHRSGTSILNRIMQTHTLVTGFSGTGASEDEGQHLQTVIPHDGEFGGPGTFCFDHRARLTEHDLARYESGILRIMEAWERHWDDARPVRVEKSPPNLIRSRFLQAAFPESRFVFIVRHPLVVSMATQKWSEASPEALVAHWMAGHRIMLEDAPHLKRLYVVRYEDIAMSPDEVVAGIWRFIGVDARAIPTNMFENRNNDYLGRVGDLLPLRVEQLPRDGTAIMRRFSYALEAPYARDLGDWRFDMERGLRESLPVNSAEMTSDGG